MSDCQKDLMALGGAYPRTCAKCGLGPCHKTLFGNSPLAWPDGPSRLFHPTDGTIAISGLWLVKRGNYAFVYAEINKQWVEIAREPADNTFSHIVEVGGIERNVRDPQKRF